MELYVGLDVGLEETSICVVDKDGKNVRETKVATEPGRFAPLLRASRIASAASVLRRRRWGCGCTANFIRLGCR